MERTTGAAEPRPIVLSNAVTGMTLRILRSAADTGGALLEMEAGYPPGSAVPPPHLHPLQEERFAVLEGHMRAVVGGAARDLVAGDSLRIPAGEAHAMWNPGTVGARLSWQVRPALRTQEFFEVFFALAARGMVDARGVPGLLDLALLAPHFRSEIRVTQPPEWVQRLVFGALGPLARGLGRCPELRSRA